MTEAEWLTRPAPRKLLEHLEEFGKVPERKLRLFGVVCCTRVSRWFIDPCQHLAVEVLERFADGVAGTGELDSASIAAQGIDEVDVRLSEEANPDSDMDSLDAKYHAAQVVAQATILDLPGEGNPTLFHRAHDVVMNMIDAAGCGATAAGSGGGSLAAQETERHILCDFLRCIIRNPFRPVAFDPRWRSETAVALAAGIYDGRHFDRLPILADALEDAGCDHPDLLAHLRGPGPHARGCWPLDLVLGKQ